MREEEVMRAVEVLEGDLDSGVMAGSGSDVWSPGLLCGRRRW